MAKVTRIVYSKNLNRDKLDQLIELASRLGRLRKEIWHRFGSLSGMGLTHQKIRDQWLEEKRKFDVPARLWKETLRDTFEDIKAYRESAKAKVRKAIYRRADDEIERKRFYTLLKYDQWMEDNYLRRMMRKYFKHGKTNVGNQIVLDSGCYTTFEHKGRAWIKVMGLEKRKRIAIPLNTTYLPSGTLRLILREGRVEVHFPVEDTEVCSVKPCGDKTVGIDKGYTEVFTDSDGDIHGGGLGERLSKESDYLKIKYQSRNKLQAIAEAKPHKQQNITANNLGRNKLNERKRVHTAHVRDEVFKAAHSVVDKAKVVVAEDLTQSIKGRFYGKNQNRRLSGWVRGIMAEALFSVSQRRGSALSLVNASYTSQMDSRYGVLLGQRKGDLFYCFDGVVLDADENAARNILSRLYDDEIQLYMPFKDVKNVLLERTGRFEKRLGLLNQDSSCSGQLLLFPLSTDLPAAGRERITF